MNAAWIYDKVTFPATPYTIGPVTKSVRKKDDVVHIEVRENFGSPCFRDAKSFVAELQEAIEGLADGFVDLAEANDMEPATLRLEGWRVPTEDELEVINRQCFQ